MAILSKNRDLARRFLLGSLAAAAVTSGCKFQEKLFGRGKASGSLQVTPTPVPIVNDGDALAIAAVSPAAGIYAGPVLVSIAELDQKKPYYHMRPFGGVEDGIPYDRPFIVYPPVLVYVGWADDKKIGHVIAIEYKIPDGLVSTKLPSLGRFDKHLDLATLLPCSLSPPTKLLPFEDAPGLRLYSPEEVEKTFERIDQTTGLRHDGTDDVFQGMPHLDLTRVGAWLSPGRLNLLLECQEKIDPFRAVYGWRLGTVTGLDSNAATPNAKLTFNALREIIWINGGLEIRDLPSPDGAAPVLRPRGDSFVIFRPVGSTKIGASISWENLGIDPATGPLAVTGLTRFDAKSTGLIDETYPVFLDAKLESERQVLTDVLGQTITLDVVAKIGSDPLTVEHRKYLGLALHSINQWLGIPVYDTKEIPILNYHQRDNAYGGYNAREVGIFSRLGPFTPAIIAAQLMAHEAAHHVNAVRSASQELWIQEGISEWFAERFLYQQFPKATVYLALRQLRFDRLFENAEVVDTPLKDWKDASKGGFYSKALAFFDLLENEVGYETLRDVILVARQLPLDSKKFRDEVIGRILSGPGRGRVTDLFERWVLTGGLGKEEKAHFSDADGDGLLDGDETLLGFDPTKFDSKGNGYSDGEKFAKGEESLAAASGLGLQRPAPHGLIRLVTGDSGPVNFQLFPWLTSPEDFRLGALPLHFDAPVLMPWFVGLERGPNSGSGGRGGVLQERGLFSAEGHEFPYDVTFPEIGILAVPVKAPGLIAVPPLPEDLAERVGSGAFTDDAYDIPAEAGAYDLTTMTLNESLGALNIHLDTRLPVDQNGYQGEFTLTFQTAKWSMTAVDSKKDLLLRITDGYPHWFQRSGDELSEIPLPVSLKLQRAGALDVQIHTGDLTTWLEGEGEKLICPSTVSRPFGAGQWRDDMKCVSWRNSGMARFTRFFTSPMSGSLQKIELVASKIGYSTDQLAKTLAALEKAVKSMESRLARPHKERSRWPLRLIATDSSRVFAQAYSQLGAMLTIAPYASFDFVIPLAIEQLARVHLADIRERRIENPFWMQDLYVHWLASSVITDVLGSATALRYSHWRINDYAGFIQGRSEYAGHFAADRSLMEMSADPDSGYAGEKILMFAQVLDAVIGAKGMSQVMRTFTLAEWDNRILLSGLIAARPDKADEIGNLWKIFVTGTPNSAADRSQIGALFEVSPLNSRLYQFEGDAVVRGGGTPANYPNP